MINMINNPPPGCKEIVDNHFKIKKNEIMNTLIKWNKNTHSSNLDKNIKILKLLLDKY